MEPLYGEILTPGRRTPPLCKAPLVCRVKVLKCYFWLFTALAKSTHQFDVCSWREQWRRVAPVVVIVCSLVDFAVQIAFVDL